jgi:hypothetical protein
MSNTEGVTSGNMHSLAPDPEAHNVQNTHLVLNAYNGAPMVGMTDQVVGLTLIDPQTLPSLIPFPRLETLTIASPPDGPKPQKHQLSAICPPSVKKIKLVRAPGVEVDELPVACTDLSITRPGKKINIGVIGGLSRVTELRLNACKLNDADLIDIVTLCPKLETLQLPNNEPGMLRGVEMARRQGCTMPPLLSFDASFTGPTSDVPDCSWIGSVVEAFPHLEKLKLNASRVPYELLGLQSLTCLSIHLTKGLTVAKVAPILHILPTLERLEVIVNRNDDVEAAESLLRTVARSVKVQSREEAKHSVSLSMLNARNLLHSLHHCPSW